MPAHSTKVLVQQMLRLFAVNDLTICDANLLNGVLGVIIRGALLCLRKWRPLNAEPGSFVHCASKHVTLRVKQKGIGGYNPRRSVLTCYGKLLAPNASESGAPLLHYINTGVA